MNKENPVLIMELSGEKRRLELRNVSENDIPETLNGESGFHVYHVRMLTELILREYNRIHGGAALTEEKIVSISIASSLHDIGKSQIPKSILDFPGRLSPTEFDIVKKHSAFGAALIRGAEPGDIPEDILKYAAEISLYHHERYDGTGYPEGLKGDSIPLWAQAVALADSFDALTSSRSYKEALSRDVAIQMISSGMCGVFNEELVECLMGVVNHSVLVSLREVLKKRRAVTEDVSGFAPKRVLFIGNTEYLTKAFVEATFPDSKVMVVGNTDLEGGGRIKLFRIKKPSVKAVFDTYEFDAVIYLSGELTYKSTEKSDSEEFREVLRCAKETQKQVKVLYLASLDSALSPMTDKAIISSAKEQLCAYYRKNGGLDVKTVQIPYLYSGTCTHDFLYNLFERIHEGKKAVIDAAADDRIRFISLYDLSVLLIRLFDNWNTGDGVLTVNDEFGLKFSDLTDKISRIAVNSNIVFTGNPTSGSTNANNKALRNEYGWFAQISVLEDLPEQYDRYLELKREKSETLFTKIRNWFARHSLLLKLLELVLLFIVSELLMLTTDSAVIFSIVDFRTIYVVIMATMHGLTFGIASAALSSLSWLAAKVMSGTALMTIFYEPTNWMAFVFYFLVGAVCGYVKLAKDDKIKAVTEQNKLLEDKLVFTRDIYEDTYREKRELKKQIIGSKDSFGKIFDITRKLDTVAPQQLYLRIMDIFEDVLENKSITVYSLNSMSTFGRLEVASRDMIESVSRSISTDTYADIISELKGGEIWRNVDMLPDHPMYAAGVYRNGNPVLLIFIWHAGIEQRSLYYVNLFKILRDLIEMSMLRAYDYNMAVYDKQYIKGTHIMTAEAFAECLGNFRGLAERKVSTFVLLEFDLRGHSYIEADAMLAGKVRANDILGATEDGKLRALLSQATDKDLRFIMPRFEGLDADITVIR